MSFEIIHQKKPSYSGGLAVLIVLLSLLMLGLGVVFAYLLISDKGSNYVLGTLTAFICLLAGINIVLFAKAFLPFREVSEDREEELLW